MAKIIDFNNFSKNGKINNLLKKLRIPIAVLLVIILILLIYASVGETRRSNIADSFRAIPSSFGDSPGYPYSEDDLSLKKMLLIGDKPLVVTSTGVQVLSPDADELFNLHLEWGDTKAVSANGRALIFSNSSDKSFLISRTKELARFDADGVTYTGTVSKNGSVAVASRLDNVQSFVQVFNTRQKFMFAWECSKDYVSSLALSSNGKKIVVSAVGVENAEIYSRVILFKSGKDAPTFEKKYRGTCILKTVYTSGGKIIAVGDNKTIILNSKGKEIETIEYADDALFSVNNDLSGDTLVAYKEFGGSKIKVLIIPSFGKKNKGFELDYMPSCIEISKNKVYASIGNEVKAYAANGNIKKQYNCSSNVSSVHISSVGIYTVENGSICKYQ